MATIQYDTNLLSPNNSSGPGWYDGSGNPNGGFTVDTENGIEVGLRVKLRQDPNVIDTPTDVYLVPVGAQLSSPSHAAWNYEFSIDLRPGGVGTLTLSDITASLTITDVTTGATATVDALGYFGDNSGYGTGGKVTPATGAEWGSQNSENPIFGSFPLAADYDENAVRLYQFDLTVSEGATLLASDTVFAQTVAPEPGPLALVAIGLALMLARFQRRFGAR